MAIFPPGAVLALAGPQPLEIQGRALQGYHRPLGGEVASLTMTVADPAQLFSDWLQAPPLGSACRIDYDGVPIMTGYLYAMRATAAGIELRIEG